MKWIEQFAGRPGVKRMAVENFLMSLDDLSEREAKQNLAQDARLYKWNKETKKAIRDGIKYYFG